MEENQSHEKVAVVPGLTFEGPMADLYAALAKAQIGFEPILKTREVRVSPRNSPAYTFMYAPLDEVILKTRKALNAEGLCLFQPFSYDSDNVPVIRTILAHSSGAKITCEFPLQANKREWDEKTNAWRERPLTMQELGSQMTYARRYSYGCLTGVTSEEDDDGNAGDGNEREVRERTPNNRPTPPPMPSTTKPAVTDAQRRGTYDRAAAADKVAGPAAVAAVRGTPKPAPSGGTPVVPANKPPPDRAPQNGAPSPLASQPAQASALVPAIGETYSNMLANVPDPTAAAQAAIAKAMAELPAAEAPLADPNDVISDDGVVGEVRWVEPEDKTPATDSSKKILGQTARELRFTRPLLDELCVRTVGIPAGLLSYEADFRAVQKALVAAGART